MPSPVFGKAIARVAELVYAHDLKSCPSRDVGSMPTSGTIDLFLFHLDAGDCVHHNLCGNVGVE
jgi:hypothetical protein